MDDKLILICINQRSNPALPSCGMRGSKQLFEIIKSEIHSQNLNIRLQSLKCLGNCENGPNIKLSPNGSILSNVSIENVDYAISEINKFCSSK